MKVITAPEKYDSNFMDITCFLAGGITNCANWQDEVIKELSKFKDTDDLIIFNPRRENFPIHDPNAAREQITWEFNMLDECDIFSMYFCNSDSDQPICMYELGMNLEKTFKKADKSSEYWSDVPREIMRRLVINCEKGYKRASDVQIQTELALDSQNITSDIVDLDANPHKHALDIYHAYKNYRKY